MRLCKEVIEKGEIIKSSEYVKITSEDRFIIYFLLVWPK